MTCNFLTDPAGKVVMIACGPGRWSHLVEAKCPWCCLGEDRTVCGFREVFGGWEAPDLICGSCGQFFSAEYGPSKVTNDDRNKHIATVAEMRNTHEVGPWPQPSALALAEEMEAEEPSAEERS